MKVSVTIPTYNGEAYLAEAIKSVLDQTLQDFELVIVDDRSTDSTLDILRSFSDSRIRFTRNDERLGLPGNWNRCLSLARGEFICLFHQDDVMLPDNLERKVRLLSSDPGVGFVHSSAEVLVEPEAPSLPAEWIEKSFEDFVVEGREYFFKLLFQGNIICAPTVVARRQQLLDLGGFDEELAFTSDYEMWMKVCVDHRVAFLSQPLVRYRWHSKNASHDFQFERGAQECDSASRHALRFYGERTGHGKEEAMLREALAGITKLRQWNATLQRQKGWIAELEKGNKWLEGQRIELQNAVNGQKSLIEEQKAWIGELERGKDWLEEQRAAWQKHAEETQSRIESGLFKLTKTFKAVLIAVLVAVILVNPIVLLLVLRFFGPHK